MLSFIFLVSLCTFVLRYLAVCNTAELLLLILLLKFILIIIIIIIIKIYSRLLFIIRVSPGDQSDLPQTFTKDVCSVH
jgi:hypothetical protein